MRKHYQKFSEEDRRTVRAWQFGVTALYAGVFLCFVSAVILNNAVRGWASEAAQAEMTTTKPDADPVQIANGKKAGVFGYASHP